MSSWFESMFSGLAGASKACVLSVFFLSILITACAGKVTRPVSESDRDTSGQYDGWWGVKSTRTLSPQTFGTWRSNCTDPKLDFPFEVVAGEAKITSNNVEHSAFVDKDGRFRMIFPSDERVGASVSSTRDLNSEMQFVIEGILSEEPPVGRYIRELVQLGDGCKSNLAYTKLPGRP